MIPGLSFAQENSSLDTVNKVSVRSVQPFFQPLDSTTPHFYQPTVTYLSPLKESPIKFSSVGASWKETLPPNTYITLEIRLRSEGQLSDWYVLHPDIDEQIDQSDLSQKTSFITANLSDAYQYRVNLNSQDQTQTPVLDDLKFTFIDGGSPDQRTSIIKEEHHQAVSSISNLEFTASVLGVPSDYILSTDQDSSLIKSSSLTAQAESVTVLPTTAIKRIRPKVVKSSSINTVGPKVISRSEWGADESIRIYTPSASQNEAKLVKLEDDYYTKFADELKESKRITTDENGNTLTWPLSYPEGIKKIVIHHTATAKDLEDPAKAIRDIYYWHTKTKGWGDIGYNYIIDPQGNIYEGRYGGEMVVGAHAGRGNHGSIGIAVLGNYQEQDAPEEVISALTALIKSKAELYHIDTEGSDLFRGENFPNVMGHRDIMSTSCPGDKLYAMLPIIRKLAKISNVTTASSTVNKDYDFAFDGNTPILSFTPKGKKTITFKIKNTGLKSWDAATYFQVNNNQNAKTFLKSSEQILSSTTGKEVKPGESVEIKMLAVASNTSGSGLIEIFPVISGQHKIERYLSLGLRTSTPAPLAKYDYELISIIYSQTEFKKGDKVNVQVKLRNKGVSPWQKTGSNKVNLGADKARDHLSTLLEKPSNRYGSMEQELVKNGEIGTFNFTIKIPSQDGVYREYFTPVIEGVQWMTNKDSYLQVKVGNSDSLMTGEQGDPEGAVQSASFLKPASTGAESIRAKSPTIPLNNSTKEISSNPTPTGSGTVNIATEKLDINSSPRPIRIDLAYRGNPAQITANGKFYLYQGAQKLASFDADQILTLKYQDGGFMVTSATSKWNVSAKPRFIPADNSVIMRIENWERRNTWGEKANNNEFRGTLEGIIYDNELHFVNELPLEDYLKGLAEESSSEPDEKIKAIMIIARTYARFYMDVTRKFPGAPFDLNDDPNYSQKYTGYSFEKRSAKTAQMAAATAGQYVTYQGKLIKTPFFSKSDGKRTISAKDKWGWTDTPFLTSVDDSLCNSTAFAGHGVGLSGCGATAMANLGKTSQEIIKYYYQGTEITQTAY